MLYAKAFHLQDSSWYLTLAFSTSEQNWYSPSGTHPLCRPKATANTCWLAASSSLEEACFPHIPNTLLPPRDKSASGWSSLRALSPQPGDQLGDPHSQAKAEPHAHVYSSPLHLPRALLSLRLSATSLAPPSTQPWVE